MTMLKFRAWDKVNNEMFEVAEMDFIFDTVSDKKYYSVSFDEIELMQSTGLVDMHYNEIFEGDVVKVLNSLYTVFYDGERGSFRLKPHDKRWHTDYMSNFSGGGNFEVVGNIYENPELVEEVE